MSVDVEHDPNTLGRIPANTGKRVHFSNGSFYRWPQHRWSLSHIDELVPTKNVWRGSGAAIDIPYNLLDFEEVFIDTTDAGKLSWQDALSQTHTDGLLILQRGKIVYEGYFGASGPHIRHIIQAANKSFIGILAETLIFDQLLDENALVPSIVPELAGSAYGGATVRQVLDMLISMQFHEDYLDPVSEIWHFHRATGMSPPKIGEPLEAVADVLPNVLKQGQHGEAFAYREPNIFVLGWIVRRVCGQDIAAELSSRIWQHIGAEHDGYYRVDASGAESSSGFTLRDFARFGELFRTGGAIGDRQIIPTSVIEKVMQGGDPALFAKAGYKTMPGWSYKSQWWIRHIDGRTCPAARGAHGQVLYIDPTNDLVVARFGSSPKAPSALIDGIFLPTLDAITAKLNMATSI